MADVASGDGVTGINGQINATPARMAILPEPLSQLLDVTLANTTEAVTHVEWAHVPRWLKAVLGDAWDIPYGLVTVGGTAAYALWHLADADVSDSPITVHIHVESVIGQDGSLDIDQSVNNARERVRDILMSTMRDGVWTMRTLPGLEESSLQYADSIDAGRIVVIAGNVVMDIGGMSSSAALLPHALKLFNYTARRQSEAWPFVVPRLRRQLVRTMIGTANATTLRGNEAEADIITIHGVDSRFSVVFTSDRMIVTASARCDGSGVLFDRQIIEEMEDKDGHAVSFLFVVRELGCHVVRVYVADSETMVTATQEIHVEVVEA
ncbi:hypothetical protein M378DRAFT_166453 [Amanita muscaria Koide BX008]|uniref:Uncharacterized protein n=1 Tax=Amanita muscaria (strain Koide BX008) TaxID=946122 RepID=A0A0C2WZG7_AMAMK|nr:hypothetical protein M378DRAFT_166453 [Amanita muscaria Koide BX008]